ncbi:MAG: helix-turn-helix transcriptional regulator [Chloroflexota bacterium]
MKNIVGKQIKEIREKAGITQEQLAIRLEMAGWQVDRFLVSKIERGERQVLDTEVQLIAKVLKVSVSSLFGKDI